MKSYLDSLKAQAEAQAHAYSRERARNAYPGGTPDFEPLERQLGRWWSSLPPIVQERKFRLAEIAANLRGKFRPKPSAQHVAAALRVLGWQETRDWTTAGRNLRYWIPPEQR